MPLCFTGSQGSRARPAVPIHIEQNKIYERETEKDMNTFTIPSLSFFNCDTLYEDDTALSRKPYSVTGDYNDSGDQNNYQASFTNESSEQPYEQYEHSGNYGQHENYEQNQNYTQGDNFRHDGIYGQNSNPDFYNISDRTSNFNKPYSDTYESAEKDQYYEYNHHHHHHHYEDTFPNYTQQNYQNYFSEETPQEYPACSYQHNAQPRVMSGYNMNFSDEAHPIGDRGQSSHDLQDSATFPTYDQTDYTPVYNTQETHGSYDYQNYEMQHSTMYHAERDMHQYNMSHDQYSMSHEAYAMHSGESFSQHNYHAHDQMSRDGAYQTQTEMNSSKYLSQSCQSDQQGYQQEMTRNLNLVPTSVEGNENQINTSSTLINQNYSTTTNSEKLLDYHLMCEGPLENLNKPTEISDSPAQHQPDQTPMFSSPNRNENKENFSERTELAIPQSDFTETSDSMKYKCTEASSLERHVLEEQGESQSESQDLKFFETIKKFTQPPPSFDILSESKQNSIKHMKVSTSHE